MMKPLPILTLSLLLAACGGGGSSGGGSGSPTAPGPPAEVAGQWTGTTGGTRVEGPSCLGDPITVPLDADISQQGASLSLELTFNRAITCLFEGMVGETSIAWEFSSRQTNPLCTLNEPFPCRQPNGSIQFLQLRLRESGLSGTVSGNTITASGESVSDLIEVSSGRNVGVYRVQNRVELRRR